MAVSAAIALNTMAKRSDSSNAPLHFAKRAKNDEFYTLLSDIEAELRHYRKHLRNKIIFCNCDDPYESNFFKYFVLNFNFLGLRKLIATCYAASPIANTEGALFDHEQPKEKATKNPHKIEISEVPKNEEKGFDLANVAYLLQNKKNVLTQLQGDGDFRSPECVELMKQCDVVVTNPPFSLFREFVAQLMEYEKKFLIIGSMNAITYKEIFKIIKENKLWLGYGFRGGNAYFKVSSDNTDYVAGVYNSETGTVKFRNVHWFTNLDTPKRHEELKLYKSYNAAQYPTYDNYDAIEVSKVADIPMDYENAMGVPISFLNKYNPKQFEILKFRKGNDDKDLSINGKCPYFRVIIRKRGNY